MQILLKWICYFKYRSQHINWIIWVDFFLTNSLFIWYLFRLYKKTLKKSQRLNKNDYSKDKKIKIKNINVLKLE